MKTFTAKVVAAYLENNALEAHEIPNLIQSVYAALSRLSAQGGEAIVPMTLEPAVSIKKSVTPDAIICLECGRPQKMIKRHLGTSHGLTVDEYRAKWSLPVDYPMVAANYSQRRSELAITNGLGRKPSEASPTTGEPKTNGAPTHRYPGSRWSKPAE